MESMAALPQLGGYFSIVKLVFILVLVTPWLALSPWVQKDAKKVRTRHEMWSGVILGIPTISLFFWLILPEYIIGLLIYVVLTSAVFIAYIVHRNARVKPERKILTATHIKSLLTKSSVEKIELVTKVKLYDSTGKIVLAPNVQTSDEEEFFKYNLAQDLLFDMLWRRASEADICPVEGKTIVRYVIDGVAIACPPLSLHDSDAIIDFLKPLAGMEAQEKRRPQKGNLSVSLDKDVVDIAVATAGTTGGQRMQFRIVQQAIQTNLEGLGMTEDMLLRVKRMNQVENGVIIVSGRRGSGTTSTLYSMLSTHDAYIKQLVTLESEAVVDLENVTQHSYKEPANLPRYLASAIRREPDVIMVDQCPDPATAQLICAAAAEKTLLLGMRASDSFVALAKWVQVCGDAAEAVKNLRGILCQVLLRKLCPNCREAYRPAPQLLVKANIPAQQVDQFYRPPTTTLTDEKGNPIICPNCQGSGYYGRTAAFELLEMTDELRELIISGASVSQIKAACRKSRMLYLQEQALKKVIDGISGIKEVLRAVQPAKK